MKKILIAFIALALVACGKKEQSWSIQSPSGNLKVTLINEDEGLWYQVDNVADSSAVLLKSPLGLVRNDVSFVKNLSLCHEEEAKEIQDSYRMIIGNKRELSYTANEQAFVFENKDGREMTVLFRVFDNGVDFRYILNGSDTAEYKIMSEATGFALPATADAWIAPYELAKPWGQPGYESDYVTMKAGTPSKDSVGWAFPMLCKSGNNWILISDADLDGSYCGVHLNKNCDGGLYTVALPQHEERYGDGNVNPSSSLPWTLPWRYIVVGKNADDIAGSNMAYHLAKPNVLKDTSWIQPGIASWEWWTSTEKPTVKRLNKFVDLAAEMKWPYSLVDAGWETMKDGKIEEVAEYAKKKNVGLLFWYNSGGRRDSIKKAEDFVLYNADTREAEMARIEALGVKGIKVDFFATDKQIAIKLYLDILKDAAKHHLVVNFHGCTLPRGWSRTYPNLVGMESVLGTECYRFADSYPEAVSRYNTLAPIIRCAVGPADYTPCAFSDHNKPRKSTWAQELATTILYQNGIVHMSDKPETFAKLPAGVITYLKALPVVWDETKILMSEPGELLVIARRHGSKWYIAGVNGRNEKRTVSFTLPASRLVSKLIGDGQKMNEFSIQDITVSDKYDVSMNAYGGFVLY